MIDALDSILNLVEQRESVWGELTVLLLEREEEQVNELVDRWVHPTAASLHEVKGDAEVHHFHLGLFLAARLLVVVHQIRQYLARHVVEWNIGARSRRVHHRCLLFNFLDFFIRLHAENEVHQFGQLRLVFLRELRKQRRWLLGSLLLGLCIAASDQDHWINSPIEDDLVIIRLRDGTAPSFESTHQLHLESLLFFGWLTHFLNQQRVNPVGSFQVSLHLLWKILIAHVFILNWILNFNNRDQAILWKFRTGSGNILSNLVGLWQVLLAEHSLRIQPVIVAILILLWEVAHLCQQFLFFWQLFYLLGIQSRCVLSRLKVHWVGEDKSVIHKLLGGIQSKNRINGSIHVGTGLLAIFEVSHQYGVFMSEVLWTHWLAAERPYNFLFSIGFEHFVNKVLRLLRIKFLRHIIGLRNLLRQHGHVVFSEAHEIFLELSWKRAPLFGKNLVNFDLLVNSWACNVIWDCCLWIWIAVDNRGFSVFDTDDLAIFDYCVQLLVDLFIDPGRCDLKSQLGRAPFLDITSRCLAITSFQSNRSPKWWLLRVSSKRLLKYSWSAGSHCSAHSRSLYIGSTNESTWRSCPIPGSHTSMLVWPWEMHFRSYESLWIFGGDTWRLIGSLEQRIKTAAHCAFWAQASLRC